MTVYKCPYCGKLPQDIGIIAHKFVCSTYNCKLFEPYPAMKGFYKNIKFTNRSTAALNWNKFIFKTFL